MSRRDDCDCPVCGVEGCDNPTHLPPAVFDELHTMTSSTTSRPALTKPQKRPGLDESRLADVSRVVAEGQQLATDGIRYLVDGLIPSYGMLGMLVARAKVGKTTFAMQLGGAVARGAPFLDRETVATRVLIIAAEDPPQYTAWLARHLDDVPQGMLTFYRGPIRLDADGLAAIAYTVTTGKYGLVLIASWQAVVRGLLQHENDNAGAVNIVEHVKLFARDTAIPWLIDAHAGKGEDQADEADPSLAMRGASAAAAAADYTLSLRYTDSPFHSQRRLSGKGRFVNLAPQLLDCEGETQHYTLVGATKNIAAETTWRLIVTMGALSKTHQTAWAIAKTIGLVGPSGKPNANHLHQVRTALFKRPGVQTVIETRNDKPSTLYALADRDAADDYSVLLRETPGV